MWNVVFSTSEWTAPERGQGYPCTGDRYQIQFLPQRRNGKHWPTGDRHCPLWDRPSIIYLVGTHIPRTGNVSTVPSVYAPTLDAVYATKDVFYMKAQREINQTPWSDLVSIEIKKQDTKHPGDFRWTTSQFGVGGSSQGSTEGASKKDSPHYRRGVECTTWPTWQHHSLRVVHILSWR